jgi:hypothetical protein
MRFARRLLGVGLVACTSCSLLTDLNGYSGGASPVAEGGADAPGAAPDADAPDAPDASADAGPFCVPGAHAFCADFDTGDLLAGWTRPNVDAIGAVTLATDRSVSPARSMLATLSRRSSNAPSQYALLEEELAGFHRTRVEFDFYPKAPSWQNGDVNSGIFVLYFYSPAIAGGGDGVALSMGRDYTTLGALGTSLDGTPLPTDQWLHARVDVDPAGSIDATFGPVHFNGTFAALPQGPSSVTSLQLGISGYNQPAPEFRVYYDNVTVDFP